MQQYYEENPEVMERFMNSANIIEEEVKNISDKIEPRSPSSTYTPNGNNIVSDPSKLEGSIAAMIGASQNTGQGGHPPPMSLPGNQNGMQQFIPSHMNSQMQQYPPQSHFPPQQTNFAAPQTGPTMDSFSYQNGIPGQSMAQTYMPTQK